MQSIFYIQPSPTHEDWRVEEAIYDTSAVDPEGRYRGKNHNMCTTTARRYLFYDLYLQEQVAYPHCTLRIRCRINESREA